MTDETQKPNVAELKLQVDGMSVDHFLQDLVHFVNTSDAEFGITLLVHGMVVSGHLIDGKTYFDAFVQQFAGDNKELHASIADRGEMYATLDTDEKSEPHNSFTCEMHAAICQVPRICQRTKEFCGVERSTPCLVSRSAS